MPRPKGSKKIFSPPIQPSIILSNLNNLITTSSSNEINGNRVVINPAVLRYLEQNRNYSNRNLSININDGKDAMNLFDENFFQFDDHDELLWNFYTYSTEFLTTARLAEWILNQH